ncbi:MAG: GTPase HflX [Oscillospiraceae bacterium]|nr:GTPase HflX [Oscillospiraceae bacterium]
MIGAENTGRTYLREYSEKAVLVSADLGEWDTEYSLSELRALCDTADVEVLAEITQKLDRRNQSTYIGAGKAEEVLDLIEEVEADLIIVDDDLSGVQTRNLEKYFGVPVVDRTTLILDIFARNAVTAEGKLQVELSQLQYRLPRLIGSGTGLSQQGGGIGTRGPGETKLETDRRHIRSRIRSLKERLKDMEARREVTRRARRRNGIPIVALVGYTNVGKSSLLNILTGSSILAEDKLFATLDPTARRLPVANMQNVILVDTVGFVSRLPHHLVEAFKSTLAEAQYADLILLVADASAEDWSEQLRVTEEVLAELQCGDTPTITVFNKADLVDDADTLPGIPVSAKTGEGLEDLLAEISEKLSERVVRATLLFPFDEVGKAALLRDRGNVMSEEWVEDGLLVRASVDRALWPQYIRFQTETELPEE